MQLREFVDELAAALRAGLFVSAVLSRPRKEASPESPRIDLRCVELSGVAVVQMAWKQGAQEFHRNLNAEEFRSELVSRLGPVYRECHCRLEDQELSAYIRSRSDQVRVRRRAVEVQQPELSHNRQKQYLIPEGRRCAFLEAIGVMTAEGRVRARRQAKFRQVNRFLELVHDIVDELPSDRTLRVIDFGCGKSYLTFALHYLLTEICQRKVEITGLDLKQSVVRDCQQIADRLQCQGLTFKAGRIADFETSDEIDLVVSLHACDTATDDALAAAVSWSARVILAVPCCQHEWAPQLSNHKLSVLLDHGILRERFAALATDAYRAEWLELQGYRSQVLEFVDLEHTPKNLLIRAVRRQDAGGPRVELAERLRSFRETLGLSATHLDSMAAPIRSESDRCTAPD